MNKVRQIRKYVSSSVVVICVIATTLGLSRIAVSQDVDVPTESLNVVASLKASQWQELESGLQVIRAITEDGVVMTAFKISPENHTFSIALQNDSSGSRVKEIGEQEGAVVAINAGFFAATQSGALYSVGYLRLNNEVLSKGWEASGGVVSFSPDGLDLSPTHKGLPTGEFDVIQSKPMLIEPGGVWAMGSNNGLPKPRTIICKLGNGDVVLTTITRSGLTLYEAGWIMRSQNMGGFFGCDSALAFDGGRSTQMWYSGDDKYSSSGISPVHNFFVVRQKED